MTFESLLPLLGFDAFTEETLRKTYQKNQNKIAQIAKTAYDSESMDFPLCKRMPLTRLVVVVALLVQKYDEYKKLGVSTAIILDTFGDVAIWAKDYLRKNDKVGIKKSDVIWFRHIMNCHIFKIGSLQYQIFQMIYLDEATIGEPYMTFSEEQKTNLPAGMPVLNCHIQKGSDISADSVAKSLHDARNFFADHFPALDYKAFLCYSWLLYPPMLGLLPDQSNIKQFSEFFAIIGCCNDNNQAFERIFVGKKPTDFKNPTTLQRLAMEKKEAFGYGCGIILR